jgi:hypothetical protein
VAASTPDGGSITSSPATSPVAASADPVVNATPPSSLPNFRCEDQSGGGSVRAAITAVRVGTGSGYDRFVVEFAGDVPGFKVQRHSGSTLIEDASGRPLTLDGASTLSVVLNPASGQGSYSGPNDFKPAYPVLREARRTGDFEAVTSWGLGLARASCFRAFTLTSPARLVVDVESP